MPVSPEIDPPNKKLPVFLFSSKSMDMSVNFTEFSEKYLHH